MKILITGANGYLGKGITKSILDNGHEVIAADRTLNGIDSRVIKKASNIFDIEDPYEYYERPDVLLHLAWRDGFIHYSDAHIEDLYNHYKFIKSFIESGCKQIAIMGSMHEIGFYEGSVNEYTECHPTTHYGVCKNALRDLIDIVCKKYNCIFQWLRAYYIVGNSNEGSSIFSKIVSAVENGKEKFPFTTGENQYDFIDYEEFCIQVAAAVQQNKVCGIINICSGRPQKLSDRVERFIKENNYPIKLQYGLYPEREYDSKAIWGDDTKIRNIMKDAKNDK